MKGIVGYLLGPMHYARPRGNVKSLDDMFRSDHIGTNEAAWVVDKGGDGVVLGRHITPGGSKSTLASSSRPHPIP